MIINNMLTHLQTPLGGGEQGCPEADSALLVELEPGSAGVSLGVNQRPEDKRHPGGREELGLWSQAALDLILGFNSCQQSSRPQCREIT